MNPIAAHSSLAPELAVGLVRRPGALDARGVALAGVGAPDLLGRLGIADQVARVAFSDVAAAAAASRLVFAISDGHTERAEEVAIAIDAAKGSARLIHVADVADLAKPSVRATIARVTSVRATGAEAANILLEAHDSRFGAPEALTARIIAAAFSAANGEVKAVLELAEPGPRDWGWTPEYVDAVQKLAARERLTDMVVASGQTLTAAEMVEAAFGYFKTSAAKHVHITGAGKTVSRIDPAALRAATGWVSYTHGSDLIRALCEGAADRS